MLRRCFSALLLAALLLCLPAALGEDEEAEKPLNSGLYDGHYNYSLNEAGEARLDHLYDDPVTLSVPEALNGHRLTELGDGCMSTRLRLESVELPEGVRTIAGHAFEGCLSLTELRLPDTLETAGTGAFMNCVSLREIALPAGLRVLGNSAFHGCRRLARVALPETLEEIGESCFEFCGALEEIRIPESVTSIGRFAFFGCESLKAVRGAKGSFAEAYCLENGLPFEAE